MTHKSHKKIQVYLRGIVAERFDRLVRALGISESAVGKMAVKKLLDSEEAKIKGA